MAKRMSSGLLNGSIIVVACLLLSGVMISIGEAATTTAGTPQAAADLIYTPRFLPNVLLGAKGPADMVFLVYQYLMGLVGVVAVGVIMYGGILRTMSADPGKIKASNDYIKNALKGIVLLFGAQVLFNTINPNIVDVERIQNALQPKVKINATPYIPVGMELPGDSTSTPVVVGDGAYAGRPLADTPVSHIRSRLESIGGIAMLKECVPGGGTVGCISFQGVKQITLDGIVSMADAGVPINITSVTEAHDPGTPHAEGYKWDMRVSPGVEIAFVNNPQRFERIATRSDSYATFRDKVTGVTCSSEKPPAAPHWDCSTR